MGLRTFPAVLLLVGMAAPAMAQDAATPGPEMDLWCGHAFATVSPEVADGDANFSSQLATGSEFLLARGLLGLEESGVAAADAEARSSEIEARADTQIDGQASAADFTFEECFGLLEAEAATAAGGAVEGEPATPEAATPEAAPETAPAPAPAP